MMASYGLETLHAAQRHAEEYSYTLPLAPKHSVLKGTFVFMCTEPFSERTPRSQFSFHVDYSNGSFRLSSKNLYLLSHLAQSRVLFINHFGFFNGTEQRIAPLYQVNTTCDLFLSICSSGWPSTEDSPASTCSNSTSCTVSNHVFLVLEIIPRTLSMLKKAFNQSYIPRILV